MSATETDTASEVLTIDEAAAILRISRNSALGASLRVLALTEEAVRRGAMPTQDSRLLILHWIHGYSNTEIAEPDGLRPCTVRKHRRDAELRLAEFAA